MKKIWDSSWGKEDVILVFIVALVNIVGFVAVIQYVL